MKFQLDENGNKIKQVKINIQKIKGIISGGIEEGFFSPIEIELAFMKIRDKIEELEKNIFPSKENGTAYLCVDFIDTEPYNKVSKFDIDGISINEIAKVIELLSGTKTTKISNELKNKLENAFEDLKKDIINPLVIAHLETENKKQSIYLIAKDPDEDLYYGILENEFTKKREIAGIPYTNIKNTEYILKPINPFRAKAYIDNKDQNDAKSFFENDKLFQKHTIFIHLVKKEDYIIKVKDQILNNLKFSEGISGIPMMISLTKKVISHELISDKIKFNYETDFLGLNSFPGIIGLFPLLSKYCYKPKNVNHLLSLMENSRNGQLLEFLTNLRQYSKESNINELVEILNKPESNPNIQESDIKITSLNKDILILNSGAYENIFYKYITEETLKPYRKK